MAAKIKTVTVPHPRLPVSVSLAEGEIVVLAGDGTLWAAHGDSIDEVVWVRLPALPQPGRGE